MEAVQEFFKSIDGIAYIIYVSILILFILALIGYTSERKIKEQEKEEKEKQKAILEYEKSKSIEKDKVSTVLPEIAKPEEGMINNVQAVQEITNNNVN